MFLKDFLDEAVYNLKIQISNKYILCILFFFIIPFAVNFYEERMAILIFELYIAFVGIVLFSDVMQLEWSIKAHEIFYITKANKTATVLIRVIWNILFICALSLGTLIIIYLKTSMEQSSMTQALLLNYFKVAAIFIPTTVFFGMLAMTISNIFKNTIIGYVLSFIYWAFWLANMSVKFILNPFGYSAGIQSYLYSKILLLVISVVLLILNGAIINASPYYGILKFGRRYSLKKG